jgi:hypothetical protein
LLTGGRYSQVAFKSALKRLSGLNCFKNEIFFSVSLPHYKQDWFLEEAVSRYFKFLNLTKSVLKDNPVYQVNLANPANPDNLAKPSNPSYPVNLAHLAHPTNLVYPADPGNPANPAYPVKLVNPVNPDLLVPCNDIDLIWKAHRVHPAAYNKDLLEMG